MGADVFVVAFYITCVRDGKSKERNWRVNVHDLWLLDWIG